jgi:DNA primase
MSLTAQALGGSTLTDAQMAIILSLRPKEIILAFDNDNGGMFGTQAIYKALRSMLPDTLVEATMPPVGFNDWNDVLKAKGVVETLTEFAKRVKYSRDMGAMTALALSFSPVKGSR